jgi:hypothetical protein
MSMLPIFTLLFYPPPSYYQLQNFMFNHANALPKNALVVLLSLLKEAQNHYSVIQGLYLSNNTLLHRILCISVILACWPAHHSPKPLYYILSISGSLYYVVLREILPTIKDLFSVPQSSSCKPPLQWSFPLFL